MRKAHSSKDEIKVKCFYSEDGEDIAEIIKRSFLIFLKREISK